MGLKQKSASVSTRCLALMVKMYLCSLLFSFLLLLLRLLLLLLLDPDVRYVRETAADIRKVPCLTVPRKGSKLSTLPALNF